MKKFLVKAKAMIYKIMANKVGKFLFETMNVLALLVGTVFFFWHCLIMLGTIGLFCLVGTILTLIDKHKQVTK